MNKFQINSIWRWQGRTIFLSWFFICVLLLFCDDVYSKDCKQKALPSDGCQLNRHGLLVNHALHLIADKDNSSDDEDIIFGFDNGDYKKAKEKMRLTDEGLLGINTSTPSAVLDVRDRPLNFKGTINKNNADIATLTPDLRVIARFGTDTYGDSLLLRDESNAGHLPKLKSYSGMAISGGNILKVHLSPSNELYAIHDFVSMVGLDVVMLATDAENINAATDLHGIHRLNGLPRKHNHWDIRGRAITMHMNRHKFITVGIGYDEDYTPRERLDVHGAILIGNNFQTQNPVPGTIRYANGRFEGYTNDQWEDLGAKNDADILDLREIFLLPGHDERGKIAFGVESANDEYGNNYIVNSLNAPPDDSSHFLVAAEKDEYNYSTDDRHTSGGISVVTSDAPRFTVKGNGNAYIHKRLSIGVGAPVQDSALTVAGAVHIGPRNLKPATFDYDDHLADYLLWVERGIVSEDFAIANVRQWSDHVFDENYPLKPLSEVEAFIHENGHLPGVPSAEEVADDGYSMHDMTRILLEKVEELTLHTLAQQKAIEKQQEEILSLRTQLTRVAEVVDAEIGETVPVKGQQTPAQKVGSISF